MENQWKAGESRLESICFESSQKAFLEAPEKIFWKISKIFLKLTKSFIFKPSKLPAIFQSSCSTFHKFIFQHYIQIPRIIQFIHSNSKKRRNIHIWVLKYCVYRLHSGSTDKTSSFTSKQQQRKSNLVESSFPPVRCCLRTVKSFLLLKEDQYPVSCRGNWPGFAIR